MKIIVLAGGLSTERDVSFKTGEMVTNALRENGHQVILLDVFMGYSDKAEDLTGIFDRAKEVSVKVEGIPETAPDLAKIKASRADQSANFFGPNVIELCRMADIVFMALHGENGENGKIQAAFDLFGIRYTGTGYLGSALAMNKGMAKQLFLQNGIPTPSGISVKKEDGRRSVTELGLKLPCVVKPCCGGSSIGVSIVRTEQEFDAALEEAFRWENELVIEEYVEGREFSVGVIEFKALPVIEIAPIQGFYDYKNKYKAGSAVETCPANLPEAVASQMQHYAERVAQVLGLDTYSRTDFLLNKNNEIFCLEANTLPGMTPTSLLPQEAMAVGINFNRLCEKLIEISLQKYEEGSGSCL
ncbi:MAG: D-alanine--D-alanine ligase [Roseburia sp.]|nr:D-alanine--D-alanine ligase [Roseburia sp.]